MTHSEAPSRAEAGVVTLTPMTPHLGYRVDGIDLTQPISEGAQQLLRAAMATRGLLLFRGQKVSDADQLRLVDVFGRISKQGPVQKASPPITYVSNVRSDGAFGDAELRFHSDQSYFEYPMKAIMLYGIEIPAEGGETLFSNTTVAIGRLPAPVREMLSERVAYHEFDYGHYSYGADLARSIQTTKVGADHPAIARHPITGAPILMVNCDNTKELRGLPAEQSRSVLAQVHETVSDAEIVYRHRWQPDDLLVWDNLLLQHARSRFDPSARRTLRRCAIANDLEPMDA